VERKTLQQPGSTTGKGASWRIEQFEYPAGADAPSLAGWDVWTTEPTAAAEEAARIHDRGAHEAGMRTEFEGQLAEETRKSFEAGRERGMQEGRKAQHEAQAATLANADKNRVLQAAELTESFAAEREKYLHAVEHEVVELALMVAARILRREAQMDPLLLTGAVRVALGQLSSSTRVRLLVPPAELALWTETILHMPKLAARPEVVAGEAMLLGDCTIETEMGSVDLGVRAQLGEIERGFFDRVGGGIAEPVPETSASGHAPGQPVPDQQISAQADRP
jgi:flagellar assembly protein FliH